MPSPPTWLRWPAWPGRPGSVPWSRRTGYGHGAVPVARTALGAGADLLAVALVEEGLELRAAGIEAPILVLSEPPTDAMADAFAARLTPTVYTEQGIDAAAAAARVTDPTGSAQWSVHLKVDTGMHRVGAQPEDAVALAGRIRTSGLGLGGTFTHLAVADEPDRPETTLQLDRFHGVLGRLVEAGIDPGTAPRRQLGRPAGPSRRPPGPGAGGDRHLRHQPGAGGGAAGPAGAGDVGPLRGEPGQGRGRR